MLWFVIAKPNFNPVQKLNVSETPNFLVTRCFKMDVHRVRCFLKQFCTEIFIRFDDKMCFRVCCCPNIRFLRIKTHKTLLVCTLKTKPDV